MSDFFSESLALFESMRLMRRDFHRHPELGFQEARTSGIVAKALSELGLEVTAGIGKTGVVAMLEGGRPGPVVLLRFDMDALPIQEETGASTPLKTPA
jgi:amidohydrolase